MTTKKKIIIISCAALFAIYLLLGFLSAMRLTVYASPMQAAESYLSALQKRDLKNMYLYSDQLKPHLEAMLLDSNLKERERKDMVNKDYLRWSETIRKKKHSDDNLSAERKLINRWVKVDPVLPEDYRAEVLIDGDLYLTSYQDVAGDTHHFYFRLTYPSAKRAPKASFFKNTRNMQWERIQSVIIRVEARKRPTVGDWDSFLLGLNWLDALSLVYPFLRTEKPRDPSEVWMTKLCFEVDKKKLKTF